MTIFTDIAQYSYDSAGRKVVNTPPSVSRTFRMTDTSVTNMGTWTVEFVVENSDHSQVIKSTSITFNNNAGTNDRALVTITTPATPGTYTWAFRRTDTADVLAQGTFIIGSAPIA